MKTNKFKITFTVSGEIEQEIELKEEMSLEEFKALVASGDLLTTIAHYEGRPGIVFKLDEKGFHELGQVFSQEVVEGSEYTEMKCVFPEDEAGEITNPVEYPGKGCGIWSGEKCSVFRNREGGATYCYEAFLHHPDLRMEFTLFSEVGERYKPFFKGFWEDYEVDGLVEYTGHPHIADKLKTKAILG